MVRHRAFSPRTRLCLGVRRVGVGGFGVGELGLQVGRAEQSRGCDQGEGSNAPWISEKGSGGRAYMGVGRLGARSGYSCRDKTRRMGKLDCESIQDDPLYKTLIGYVIDSTMYWTTSVPKYVEIVYTNARG
jgi:hypothetical protein